jgi:hypothetical protein
VIAVFPFMENLNRLLPGTMGIALGRNPNGAVRDLVEGFRVLTEVPLALVGLAATLVAASGLALSGTITGWHLVTVLVVALVFWPSLAQVRARDTPTGPEEVPLEWAGLEAPLTPAQLRAVDEALGIDATVGASS